MRQPVPYRVLHSLHPRRLRCHRRAVEGCVQQGRPAQHRAACRDLRSGAGPGVAERPPLRAVDHLLPAYLAVRLRHGAVPGRSEGRARRPVRGCHHRWCRQVASVLLHHRPDDHPHHLLQPGHSDLPGIPGVQWPVHHHQRRPPWFHHADLSAGLQLRIQVV